MTRLETMTKYEEMLENSREKAVETRRKELSEDRWDDVIEECYDDLAAKLQNLYLKFPPVGAHDIFNLLDCTVDTMAEAEIEEEIQDAKDVAFNDRRD